MSSNRLHFTICMFCTLMQDGVVSTKISFGVCGKSKTHSSIPIFRSLMVLIFILKVYIVQNKILHSEQ
jgi:hypothetical protein